MHELKLGKKGIKEAAKLEEGSDIVAGYTETPTHIPINKPPLIFNDQLYCRGQAYKDGKCQFLKEYENCFVCILFADSTDISGKLLKFYNQPMKCDECKAAWKIAWKIAVKDNN